LSKEIPEIVVSGISQFQTVEKFLSDALFSCFSRTGRRMDANLVGAQRSSSARETPSTPQTGALNAGGTLKPSGQVR
jgi:hypothetical protein